MALDSITNFLLFPNSYIYRMKYTYQNFNLVYNEVLIGIFHSDWKNKFNLVYNELIFEGDMFMFFQLFNFRRGETK